MKCATTLDCHEQSQQRRFRRRADKELLVGVAIVSSLVIGVTSNLRKKTQLPPLELFSQINITDNHFSEAPIEDFDQVHVPNRSSNIAKMISVLKPEYSLSKRNEVAAKIQHALRKYNIEPQIVLAIIDTESNFNHDLVSSTGDLSMAQINVEVWNKELTRMNMTPIVADKLKADETYSLEVMAKILNILKKRYEKKDKKWYARYHSKTKKHKGVYLSKVEKRLRLLSKSRVVTLH